MSDFHSNRVEDIELERMSRFNEVYITSPSQRKTGVPKTVHPRILPGNVVFKDADRLSPARPTRTSAPLPHLPRRNGSFLPQEPARHVSARSANGTPPNVGKRRDYASSLLASPARPSHSSKMAKIFRDARASLRKENVAPASPLASPIVPPAPLSPLVSRSPNVVTPSPCVRSRESVQDLNRERIDYPLLPRSSPLRRPSATRSPTRTPPRLIPQISPSRYAPQLPRPAATHHHTRTAPLPLTLHIPTDTATTHHRPATPSSAASSASWSDDALFLPTPPAPAPPRPAGPSTARISSWLAAVPASPPDLAAASPDAYAWAGDAESVDWHAKQLRARDRRGRDADDAHAASASGGSASPAPARVAGEPRHDRAGPPTPGRARSRFARRRGDEGAHGVAPALASPRLFAPPSLLPLSPGVAVRRGSTPRKGKTRCPSYYDEDILSGEAGGEGWEWGG